MISRLKQFIEEEPLPGKDQQYKLAPYRRLVESIDLEKAQPRVSAVCIILYPVNQAWHSILIERPAYEGVHSGQIAFPGGKVEESDSGLWYTAQRETYEEVGIPIRKLMLCREVNRSLYSAIQLYGSPLYWVFTRAT